MVAIVLLPLASVALAAPPQKVLERKFPFPPPVEWKSNYSWQVSVVGLAWGPANSPEMMSRGSAEPRREKPAYFRGRPGFVRGRPGFVRENPTFFPDRPYALAVELRAIVPGERWSSAVGGGSGLVQIKDINGDLHPPLRLTPTGFVVNVMDLKFTNSRTSDTWDFFPVSPHQKAFLFQTSLTEGGRRVSFRVLIGKDHLALVNTSPGGQNACDHFPRNFAGTIGSGAGVKLQLTKRGSKLSGAEQYTKIGKTLWLTGLIDSLGNFTLKEEYPKDHVTGVFKGAFSRGCRSMKGYFSKPDGSLLLPFEFQQIEASR